MSGQNLRDEMHRMVDGIDESKLSVYFSRWKEDLAVVGYEGDGEPITLGDLKKDVEQAEKEIENGYFLSAKDARKDAQNW